MAQVAVIEQVEFLEIPPSRGINFFSDTQGLGVLISANHPSWVGYQLLRYLARHYPDAGYVSFGNFQSPVAVPDPCRGTRLVIIRSVSLLAKDQVEQKRRCAENCYYPELGEALLRALGEIDFILFADPSGG